MSLVVRACMITAFELSTTGNRTHEYHLSESRESISSEVVAFATF